MLSNFNFTSMFFPQRSKGLNCVGRDFSEYFSGKINYTFFKFLTGYIGTHVFHFEQTKNFPKSNFPSFSLDLDVV